MTRHETFLPTPDYVKTPNKWNKLVLCGTKKEGEWDREVDCPFIFQHGDHYGMTYVGFDGAGYRTGLAFSDDLVHWEKQGVIIDRQPGKPYLENSIALTWILRENELYAGGRLKQVDGKYVGAYFAMPERGYEAGPGAIGLCFSSDLLHWQVEPPFLFPEEGEPWERGGLYKACLVEDEGVYHLFYNAKNETEYEKPETTELVFQRVFSWQEQIGVVESKDLKEWTRYPGNPILRNGGPGTPDERVIGDACILRHEGQWVWFNYCIGADSGTCDRVALSQDLRSPIKCEEVLLGRGGPGSLDEDMACKPAVIAKDGVLYHFYTAIDMQGGNGISFATSRPLH